MKTPMKLKTVLFFVIACMFTTIASAQTDKGKPLASPRDSVSGTVAGSTITINYGSPSVKGRKIWGGLVPYKTVWRTGANEATTFTTTKSITVEGKKLAAGTYGFFAIPTATSWTIIFNSVPKQWGAFKYDMMKDQLRVDVMPVALPAVKEMLGYNIAPTGFSLDWEMLSVPVAVE